MATISAQVSHPLPGVTFVTWAGITENDDGQPVDWGGRADRSVHVLGTFGTGGSLRIEGSNVPVPSVGGDYATLNDPQANPLDFTAAKIEQVLENTRWIRPRVTAGTGVSLTVHMILRGDTR